MYTHTKSLGEINNLDTAVNHASLNQEGNTREERRVRNDSGNVDIILTC